MSLDGLPPLRAIIRTHDLKAKKSFGQNFLMDLNLTCRIARLGNVNGRTVIEVGPGPGGLTRALLHEGAKRVIAIERDDRCRPVMDEIAAHQPGRLQPVFDDALKLDLSLLANDDGAQKPLIVANLPYGVATPLLIKWLETEPWPPWWDRMVLMYQREVAERIVAEPETKAYGRLAILAQWRTTPRIVMNLPAEAFTPPPKVTSSVVTFDPLPHPIAPCAMADLAKVTAAAFGQRRKMLRQSLKSLTPQPEAVLEAAGIAPERRAETLSVADFANLARAYAALYPSA
ncbi:MAG: 16S rRNA (adenine(1518)-N(6)/adenine(1519)-N(6))-dimethyltransferase RsmA [Pseudomonadota bacterium]